MAQRALHLSHVSHEPGATCLTPGSRLTLCKGLSTLVHVGQELGVEDVVGQPAHVWSIHHPILSGLACWIRLLDLPELDIFKHSLDRQFEF